MDSVQNMIADGSDTFIEIGPGKVLRGLIKRIDEHSETSGWKDILDNRV